MLSGYTIFRATQGATKVGAANAIRATQGATKVGAANAIRATQGAPFAMRALSPPSLSGAANAL